MTAVYHELRDEFVDPTTNERPFRLLCYEGVQCGPVRLGHSGASSLIQLSGATCDSAWTRLASLGGTPTRLDVQTTLQLPTSQPRWYLRPLRRETRTKHRPPSNLPSVGLRMDTRGLRLGTVGDRTKSRYLRVYDKGVESGTQPPGHLWRLELEAKKRLAPRLWGDLLASSDARQWCYDTLSEQWPLSGRRWPLTPGTRGVEGLTVPSDAAPDSVRLRRWIDESVAPAVQRALAKYSRAELRAALNLDEPDAIPEA